MMNPTLTRMLANMVTKANPEVALKAPRETPPPYPGYYVVTWYKMISRLAVIIGHNGTLALEADAALVHRPNNSELMLEAVAWAHSSMDQARTCLRDGRAIPSEILGEISAWVNQPDWPPYADDINNPYLPGLNESQHLGDMSSLLQYKYEHIRDLLDEVLALGVSDAVRADIEQDRDGYDMLATLARYGAVYAAYIPYEVYYDLHEYMLAKKAA